jgi:hypothetical protein
MGADPPVNVMPIFIKLHGDAKPVHIPDRKYSRPQLRFLRDKICELEELNLMYKNSEAE